MIENRGIHYLNKLVLISVCFFGGISLLGQESLKTPDNIVCGADRTDVYIDFIRGRKIGLVANPSSRIGEVHLLDSLLSLGISVERVFCPEHGFRGQGEAGEIIIDHKDPVTGLEVVSIYGSKKKPDPSDLLGIEVLIFDIQDVGTRFYTYISTLHYIMEAAAENSVDLIILDRPNPNGFYVDGPVREAGFESFVGMHPIPVVHGMTIGEYGQMINGQGWLADSLKCNLRVIACLNYNHLCTYELPVKPSPNLPNAASVLLYPSLCFFEGSVASVGRGTEYPFQVYGHPVMNGNFKFIPKAIQGAALHPKLEGETCNGYDLRDIGPKRILSERRLILEWVIEAYQATNLEGDFFTAYFNTLMGNSWVREDIIKGTPEVKIREKWASGVEDFKKIRKKYLLYPDFE